MPEVRTYSTLGSQSRLNESNRDSLGVVVVVLVTVGVGVGVTVGVAIGSKRRRLYLNVIDNDVIVYHCLNATEKQSACTCSRRTVVRHGEHSGRP